MERMKIHNPYNAPVFHEDTVSSTMDVSKKLAEEGFSHGTVICADFQEEGRGRIPRRKWLSDRLAGLAFTVLLRYRQMENIPRALTLRTGLVVTQAIEDFILLLQNTKGIDAKNSAPPEILIKWPNDIMIGDKKAGGILSEANSGTPGANVHIGIGVNVTQKTFPSHLEKKAASIALCANIDITSDERFLLLEKILLRLYSELDNELCPLLTANDWKRRLEKRMYKKDKQVVFIDGEAESGREIKGALAGISETGELLIIPQGETIARAFITGELKY
ncbi:MAG: biotin--[acetyl-CoA-carboxylase] ligase [Treponema sp.]|nr:biotin--[acetyl-CoA-carboxylase] ligase [Treponema sp.]